MPICKRQILPHWFAHSYSFISFNSDCRRNYGHELGQTSVRWWRTGKPGVLQSMGLWRVGHDLVIEQQRNQRKTFVIGRGKFLTLILILCAAVEFHDASDKDLCVFYGWFEHLASQPWNVFKFIFTSSKYILSALLWTANFLSLIDFRGNLKVISSAQSLSHVWLFVTP